MNSDMVLEIVERSKDIGAQVIIYLMNGGARKNEEIMLYPTLPGLLLTGCVLFSQMKIPWK